jgi:DNA polymerase III sliding clamp (beta) subunit (PCNA family)
MIKNLSAFTAKTDIKQELAGVLVTKDKLVATDSYRLIEVQSDAGKDLSAPVIVGLPKGAKTIEHIEMAGNDATIKSKGALYPASFTLAGDRFPKYESVIPNIEDATISVSVNPEYLQDIARAFQELAKQNKGKLDGVTMHLFDTKKPIVFTNNNGTARALLMPIIKQ